MTYQPAPATERQMSYLRSLVAQTETPDIHDYLVAHGISELTGCPTAQATARRPSKSEASRLIDELAPAHGRKPYRYNARGRYVRAYTPCTHEDYPCCGCER